MIDIAVIPARGGSRGLHKKNLRKIGGISLVGHAVLASLRAGIVMETYVSTDNHEIAEDAERHGAKILWRDASLSDDSCRTIDVIIDALRQIDKESGKLMLLQPTSPLRNSSDIREAYNIYTSNACHAVVSITESEHHPYKVLIMQDGGALSPLKESSFLETPRQTLPVCYRINGAIYINEIREILRLRSFFCDSMGYYRMPAYRSIDIDNDIDLDLARLLYERHKKDE